jgi:protein Mpv17
LIVSETCSTGVIAVVSLAVLTQLASAGGWSLQETAIHTSTNIWNSYSEILSTSPVQTKAVTSATVYTIGDVISQRTEGASMSELDGPRIGRSLLAGLLGHGPLSHVWYEVSENLFQNILHLPNDIFGTAAKVVIDQTTWGPFWNNTYILLLGLMKLNSFETIFSEMKRTTIPLIVSGLKLWPLAHCVTYGLVPVENRLLWVDVVEIAWVTILATTAAAGGKSDAGKEKQPNTQ